MSLENRWVLEVIPEGNGLALDLGGGRGSLGPHVEAKGYKYINLDIRRFENGQPTVFGSAHERPFRDEVFDLVISKDSLEHFLEPWRAVSEVYWLLASGFCHCAPGEPSLDLQPTESYRFGAAGAPALVSCGFAGAPGSGMAGQVVHKKRLRPRSLAVAYRVVARKPSLR